MKNLPLLLFTTLFLQCIFCGCGKNEIDSSYTVEEVAVLPEQIYECSGLVLTNGRFLYINDGGSGPSIYLSTDQFNFLGQFDFNNIENIDWEAITMYDNQPIIGDIGNNFGKRTDMQFHILNAQEFNVERSIDLIYADQQDFSHQTIHNYDAEAFVAIDTSLYIFTKNKATPNSSIYSLNISKPQSAQKLQDIEVPAFVTDACLTMDGNIALLCNDQVVGSFSVSIVLLEFKDGEFEQIEVVDIPEITGQFEGIVQTSQNEFIIASESFLGEDGKLFRISF